MYCFRYHLRFFSLFSIPCLLLHPPQKFNIIFNFLILVYSSKTFRRHRCRRQPQRKQRQRLVIRRRINVTELTDDADIKEPSYKNGIYLRTISIPWKQIPHHKILVRLWTSKSSSESWLVGNTGKNMVSKPKNKVEETKPRTGCKWSNTSRHSF